MGWFISHERHSEIDESPLVQMSCEALPLLEFLSVSINLLIYCMSPAMLMRLVCIRSRGRALKQRLIGGKNIPIRLPRELGSMLIVFVTPIMHR